MAAKLPLRLLAKLDSKVNLMKVSLSCFVLSSEIDPYVVVDGDIAYWKAGA